jgi:hypothetical protein
MYKLDIEDFHDLNKYEYGLNLPGHVQSIFILVK